MGSTEGSKAEVIIFTIIYAMVMLVALVGNALLIYIVWKKPEVRSLTSFMFVNMAVADLLVTLVMMPWSIAHRYTKSEWLIKGTIGDFTCRGVISTAYVTVMASILCLTFIAVDRFYMVFYPFRRRVWFRKPTVLTPLIWILSIVSTSVIPVTYHLRQTNSRCGYNFEIWGRDRGEVKAAIRGFFLYIFFIFYLFPLCVTSILYAKMAKKLWFHRVPGNPLNQTQRQQELKTRKVVRALIITVLVFALCWLPSQAYHLFLAITSWDVQVPLVAMYLCYWFGHANSAINPWLYIYFNSHMTGCNGIIRRKSNP